MKTLRDSFGEMPRLKTVAARLYLLCALTAMCALLVLAVAAWMWLVRRMGA